MGQSKFHRVRAQHTIRYIPISKFIDFCRIVKSIVHVIEKNAKTVGQHKFLRVQAQCTIKHTPIAYTSTINEDLDWTNFANL
jgi:hypothetical protein